MRGKKSRQYRRIWSFTGFARASGEVVCTVSHRDLAPEQACLACRAST